MGKNRKIIGLTGGIASGKTLVSTYFKQFGIPVCDSDQLARDVVEKGSVGLEKLVSYFGENILLSSGNLNRKLLGQIIFNDSEKRQAVNTMLHPLIFEKIDHWIEEQTQPLLVIDMPLLFETGYYKKVDDIIVVTVNEETQLKRLKMRDDLSDADAQKRIRTQWSMSKKEKLASVTIDNNYDRLYTEKQVREYILNNQ